MRFILALAVMAAMLTGNAVRAARPQAVIHYRPDGKLLVLPVRFAHRPLQWFTLDSGAPHSVIDPRLAAQLGLKVLAQGSVTGTGQGRVDAPRGEAVDLRIGTLALHIAEPWLIDLSGVPIAKDVRGLIGYDLFAGRIIQIDPLRRTLAVFDPQAFTPPDGSVAIPLIVDKGKLYVDVVLDVKPGLQVTHRLRVDLGSEESVNDEIVGQALETHTTVLGGGLGANFEAKSGVLDAVHLGPFTISHVWGPGAPGPAIGMEVFRRFTSAFDEKHGRLYLKPNASFDEPVPAPAP